MKRFLMCVLVLVLLISSLPAALGEGRELSEAELDYVKLQLQVPDDVVITDYECSETWFWEGAMMTLFDISLYSGNQFVGSASLDADTLEAVRYIIYFSEYEVDTSKLIYKSDQAATDSGSHDQLQDDEPSPESGYSCQYDIYEDGEPETIQLYKYYGIFENSYEEPCIIMRITLADGSIWSEGVLYNYNESEGPDYRYLLYSTKNGTFFLQVQSSYEGIADDYIFFHIDVDGLIESVHLRDPGMSDECYLYEVHSGETIYESTNPSDRGGSAYIAALNKYMSYRGYSFTGVSGHAYIDLPDSQLICAINPLQIDPNGPTPDESAAFANKDVPLPQGIHMSTSQSNHGTAVAADSNSTIIKQSTAIATADVNLRNGPGLGYTSLTVIPEGSHVYYLDDYVEDAGDITWYHISYDGMDGWSSSKYIKLE